MNSFKLIISSPEGDIWSGDAVMLSVRGISGELAILAGHIPFITSLKPCDCKIELDEGDDLIGTIDGGLLTVSKDRVSLLSGSFKWKK